MNIDERLDALTANTELMSHMLKDVIDRMDKFHDEMMIHEARWQRTLRVLRAALQAGFNGEEQEGQ